MTWPNPEFEMSSEDWPEVWFGPVKKEEGAMEFEIRCASGKLPPESPWTMKKSSNGYIITLSTFADLAEYVKRYGVVIVSECWWNPDVAMLITLYDSAIE